ncbi:hypothetical protein [Stenotrophomonas ginsengisoli]|nr:hypothetical protein [Stenotrophomonas ginsengisoli]
MQKIDLSEASVRLVDNGEGRAKGVGMKLRTSISVLVWVLCVPGIILHSTLSFPAFGGIFIGIFNPNSISFLEWCFLLMLFLSLFSWFILAEMNVAWLKGRRLHWVWPVSGVILSTAWMLPVKDGAGLVALLFVSPGVVLASFLVFWHLWRAKTAGVIDS